MNALCELTKQYAPLAGRILMALIFLTSGYGKIIGFGATATVMASKGMPLPEILLVCAIVLELVGAVLLVADDRCRWVESGDALGEKLLGRLHHGRRDLIAQAAKESADGGVHVLALRM